MTPTGSRFDDDVELIKNAVAFEEEYAPQTILCRDDAIDDLTNVLKPIYKGRPPQNAFLYGDTGVGKTAVTKHLRDELVSDIKARNSSLPNTEQTTVNTIWINCENFTTGDHKTSSYQVAVAIINQLREPGDRITATGYAPQDVYDIMYSELDSLSGSVLVVLDEIDRIGEDDTLLYELPRARDIGYLEHVRVGVIGISNDYTFRNNLSPKVKDTLCETEIKFSPYDANELSEILDQRAAVALYEDSYTQETTRLAAALAYKEASGSARRAIRLLRGAAELAETEGIQQIKEKHVRNADNKIEYSNIIESVADQDEEKLYILKALAHLSLVDKTPARTRDVHKVYRRIVQAYNSETSGKEPLTQRGMFNHLSKLVMFGFITTVELNQGRNGGQFNVHEFSDDVSPEAIKEAFASNNLSWKQVSTRNISDD